jgi:hypothetical protein
MNNARLSRHDDAVGLLGARPRGPVDNGRYAVA